MIARLIPLALVAAAAVLSQAHAQTDNGWLNLTVIHTNDVHARVDPVNDLGAACTAQDISSGHCYGGSARHKTLIQQLRQGKQHSLLLDGGDEFQGTLFYSYYKGNVTSQVMNELGYDLTTVGNHEWDDGPSTVGRFWANLKMPIVCANIDFSKEPELGKLVKPYHIFENLGVAIIGYITPTTGDISSSGPTISFTDPIVAVQKYIDELQGKGIKRILALSHNGYNPDMELAAKTRGLDLIVGGHSHSYLGDPKSPLYQGPYPTVVKNLDGDNTLIVQAYCWGRFIGNLDVSFNPEGKIVAWNGAPVQVDYSIPADQTVSKRVDVWRSEFEAWARTVLGQASAPFDTVGCRTRDCQMGNWMADATLQYVRNLKPKNKKVKHPWADLIIINSGGIRAGFAQGNVTVESVTTASPFGSFVVQTPMKGQELITSLEAVVRGRRVDNGKPVTSFIQVSGLRFTYDSRQRNSTEKLTIKAEIRDRNKKWRKISAKKVYSVVTSDFLTSGGDSIFLKQDRPEMLIHAKQDKVLMDAVKKAKVIKPVVDGRIRDVAPPAPTKRSDNEEEIDALWSLGTPEHMRY
ncbi:MAG: 5'-nucleotidase [Benniella sp.]|nr:MAG: 5'-nucleotidase [Benniella sp.]